MFNLAEILTLLVGCLLALVFIDGIRRALRIRKSKLKVDLIDLSSEVSLDFEEEWKQGFEENEDSNEIAVYEGWFVNGHFHGVGSLNYPEGSYLYGNFRNGSPTNQVLNYYAEDDYWYIIEENNNKNKNKPENLREDIGDPPANLNGYKIRMEECYLSGQPFEDGRFAYNAIMPN